MRIIILWLLILDIEIINVFNNKAYIFSHFVVLTMWDKSVSPHIALLLCLEMH